MIKICCEKLQYGCLIFPIRKDIRKKIKKHLMENGIKSNGTHFCQNLEELEALEYFSRKK